MLNIINHQGNSKPQLDITSHPLAWLSSKRQEITSLGEYADISEPLYTVAGNVNWCNHCGKHYGYFPEKLKTELPYDSSTPLLGIYPEKKMKMLIQKDTGTSMVRAALLKTAKTWKQPKCPSTDE